MASLSKKIITIVSILLSTCLGVLSFWKYTSIDLGDGIHLDLSSPIFPTDFWTENVRCHLIFTGTLTNTQNPEYKEPFSLSYPSSLSGKILQKPSDQIFTLGGFWSDNPCSYHTFGPRFGHVFYISPKWDIVAMTNGSGGGSWEFGIYIFTRDVSHHYRLKKELDGRSMLIREKIYFWYFPVTRSIRTDPEYTKSTQQIEEWLDTFLIFIR